MVIMDTHVHVITDDRENYPRVHDTERAGTVPSITDIGQTEWPVVDEAELLATMDANGIDHATLVQTYFFYEYDNSYTVDVARRHPDRFAGICILDPLDPASPDALSDLVENQGIRGLRFMRGRIPEPSLGRPQTLPLWERAATLNLPITVNDRLGELHHLKPILERFPELPVAMEHCWGHEVGAPPFEMLAPLFDLAAYPNFYVKTAINNSQAARKAGGSPLDLYRKLLDAFGAERIMWSSNFPAHPKLGPMEDRLRAAREDFAFMSEADRTLVMGGNALRLWPMPERRR